MILFGWYSFLIRAYTLAELGITTDGSAEHMQVEVRQKCFHLFWIPFFGIGKMYAMRKGGELYELSPELENALRTHMEHKTPWYTFVGFWIVAAIFAIYIVNDKYENYVQDKSLAELHATKREILGNPIVGDQYTMQTSVMSNSFYARVADVRSSDSVMLKIVKIEQRTRSNAFRIDTISFRDEDLKFDPQWVTSSEVLRAARIENYLCDDSLQLYLPELGGMTPYVVNQIRRNGKEYW